MGRRGPQPTPTKLKLLRGETRPSRINRDEPQPADNPPEEPPDLDPAAAVVWARVMREFGHTGVIKASDTDVLRAYCETVARLEESSRLLTRSGPVVKGRLGEVVRNPLALVVRDNTTLMMQLAGALGLTPASRTGLKAPAKAPPQSALERIRAQRHAG
jgi:P27 family predicted phage terminase small subunit